MNKKFRLKDKKIIDRIFKEKKGVKNYYFNLFFTPNDQNHVRIALSIGRKFGNAVLRNLAKRRVRVIFYPYLKLLKSLDILFIIKPTASKLQFCEMNEIINKLIKQTHITDK